ncbi:unnamed protein product [Brachionus calyciflorus]|uniref:L-fucose kinase n=1 Tax=Brachionus calyciflorus TaxID=104777 RepID=A0A814ERS7_9BILA|nr:unnamed protein product [Brachionus calyciflorus]
MTKWTAIVLTCANKNSSIAYQKELELKKKKNLIDQETLIICIEDPERPIGSGGATLNALLVVSEALCAKKKLKLTVIDELKDKYILIMHMGRQYPFDLISKGFCTLPIQNQETNDLLNNFDLLYNTITYQIANFENETFKSDPGIYVCSTDMIFSIPQNEKILINDKSICVISSLAPREISKKNGIYNMQNDKYHVQNIYFQPDDDILSKSSSVDGLYNLVSGIVYLDYEVTKILFNLIIYPPMDACSYIGIDSGASPVSLSLFFDILLACCGGIDKEQYLNGQFKTNLPAFSNRAAVLKQCRLTLWNNLHHFKIHNITVSRHVKHVYMDNETFLHRKLILDSIGSYFEENSKIKKPIQKMLHCLIEDSKINSNDNPTLINCFITKCNLNIENDVYILNCDFKSSKISIGSNTCITDLKMVNEIRTIPSNLFIQNIDINLECLSTSVNLNLVFGIGDDLSKIFNSTDWTILNKNMSEFTLLTSIVEKDLWPDEISDKTLSNAKLYPVLNSNLNSEEMSYLRKYFWIDLKNSKTLNENLVKKWKQSYRYSLEDLSSIINLEEMFQKRRYIFNKANIDYLVKSVVENRPIQFNSILRNSIRDGFANEILTYFDQISLKHANDLVRLPRIMVFISNTLCEMAHNYSTIRSGPSLNLNWTNAFQQIENGQIEQALYELSKERKNWLDRDDLLIRASRHYEGAMLAFIRQATTNFKNLSSKISLKNLDNTKYRDFTWVQASCPARLDLAGAWSDTPPITYECPGGSCVTNLAILVNNEKPIGAKARVLKETKENSFFVKIIMQDSANLTDELTQVSFVFSEIDDFRDYNKPQAVGCLVKAALVFTKLIELNEQSLHDQLSKKLNGSLELCTWTGLPHGSGLGTSSILVACVLKIVWFLMGIEVSNETLSYSTLLVEQLMTTNGGWQDQVGGIWGGFKLTQAKNQLPLEINVKELKISQEFKDAINKRLILIYTGLTRLAKDLLLNVLRNWYAISSEIYKNVTELVKNGFKCANSLENEDIVEFGKCVDRHRKQKLVMAPGSEPESVVNLIKLLDPLVYGMALAGAGGGGFLYAITKEADSKDEIRNLLETFNVNMKIYDAKISDDGIEMKFF